MASHHYKILPHLIIVSAGVSIHSVSRIRRHKFYTKFQHEAIHTRYSPPLRPHHSPRTNHPDHPSRLVRRSTLRSISHHLFLRTATNTMPRRNASPATSPPQPSPRSSTIPVPQPPDSCAVSTTTVPAITPPITVPCRFSAAFVPTSRTVLSSLINVRGIRMRGQAGFPAPLLLAARARVSLRCRRRRRARERQW